MPGSRGGKASGNQPNLLAVGAITLEEGVAWWSRWHSVSRIDTGSDPEDIPAESTPQLLAEVYQGLCGWPSGVLGEKKKGRRLIPFTENYTIDRPVDDSPDAFPLVLLLIMIKKSLLPV